MGCPDWTLSFNEAAVQFWCLTQIGIVKWKDALMTRSGLVVFLIPQIRRIVTIRNCLQILILDLFLSNGYIFSSVLVPKLKLHPTHVLKLNYCLSLESGKSLF